MAAVKANYHTHSNFSDGNAPMEDYIKEAMRQGLDYLGFSEHSPLPFPNSFALQEGKIQEYVQKVRTLGTEVKSLSTSEISKRLPVLFAGLETDYIPGISEGFAAMKEQYKIDYIIGSVHLVMNENADGLWFIDGPARQIYDDGLQIYFHGDIKAAVTAYYRQLQRMVSSEKIDVVGHLDKIKMHNQNRYFLENEPWYEKLVMETLEEISARDLIIEVNTRGIYKKRCDSWFPGTEILKKIKNLKIPVLMSSDAHAPAEITALFQETTTILKSLGIFSVRLFTEDGWKDTNF